MTEVSGDLILEILKSMQNRLIKMEESIAELKTEMRAIRSHMIAMETDIVNLYSGQPKTELRLERIEKRLELADAHI